MAFFYRMGTQQDYDSLVQFWCENSGWDTLDRHGWEQRFINTPAGPSALALGTDSETGEIISQFFFIPSAVAVDGKQVRGYRPFAPIIKESVRSQGPIAFQEIITQMYFTAFASLSSEGASLIHMLPDPRWIRMLQKIPFFNFSTFPLYSHPLPLDTTIDIPPLYSIERISHYDPRIDDLWELARHNYRSMIARDSTNLAWKTSHGNYVLTGITYQSKLIGFFASVIKTHDHQWLLCDLLSIDGNESLEITLRAALREANTHYLSLSEDQRNFNKVAILATPLMQPVLERIGFSKDKYTFHALIHLFDPNLTTDEVAPEHWYFSAND